MRGDDTVSGSPEERSSTRPRGGAHPGALVKYNVSKITYPIPLRNARDLPSRGGDGDSAVLGGTGGGVRATGRLDGDDPVLGDGTRFDLWRYVAATEGSVEVVLSSADFDAFLLVGSGEGGELAVMAEDDDGAGGTDARVRLPVRAGEVYHLVATSVFPGEEGAYRLRVEPAR